MAKVEGPREPHQGRNLTCQIVPTHHTPLQFATVHRVTSSASSTHACKIMRKQISLTDGIARLPLDAQSLRNELRSLCLLSGRRYVIKMLEFFEDKKSAYIVMEYCAGGDLFNYLGGRGDGCLGWDDLTGIGFQVRNL